MDTTRITASSTTIGTAAYMAPEQVQGHDVTPAADVYALGLVLLELLTGRKGFEGTSHEVAVARLARNPDTSSGVPGAWRPLLAAMTHRAAPNRPPAAEVRDRLRSLLEAADEPTGAVGAVAPVAQVLVPAPQGGAATAGDAATMALPAAGGTTVMPAAALPRPEPAPAEVAPAGPGARRALAVVLVGLLLLVVAVAVASGGGSGQLDDVPTTQVTEPAAEPPPTTVAPATTAPPPTAKGDGAGKGGGKEKKEKGRD
jgi:hypothetical protein